MKKTVVTIFVIILIVVIGINFFIPWYFVWSVEHNNPSQTELCLSISKKLLSYKPNRNGEPITIVQVAAIRGCYRSLRILLDHGADPNEESRGITPLSNAAFFGEELHSLDWTHLS